MKALSFKSKASLYIYSYKKSTYYFLPSKIVQLELKCAFVSTVALGAS